MHDESDSARPHRAPESRLDLFKGLVEIFYGLILFPAVFFSPVFWDAVPALKLYSVAYGHFGGALLVVFNAWLMWRSSDKGPGSYIGVGFAMIFAGIAALDALIGASILIFG